jgi:signal transduction histidine kinase
MFLTFHASRLIVSVGDPISDTLRTLMLIAAVIFPLGFLIELIRFELAKMRRATDQVAALRVEVASAQQSARNRLARDLHDTAQQRLVALRIHIGLVRDGFELAEDRRAMDELASEVEAALRDIRAVARGADASSLDDLGLPLALRMATETAGIPVRIDAPGIPRFAPEVERAAYYACLEAVQNAAKHGGAGTSAEIRIVARPRRLTFAVTDNGAGMANAAEGAGLTGMRARIAGANGRLRISSVLGRGTCVVGILPLKGASPTR